MYDMLICNGDLPAFDICDLLGQGAQSITAADGGANKARECGIRPDTILGDLDSITAETLTHYRQLGVDIRYLQRQDDTDFEKALKFLLDQGAEALVILGLTGGLLDHTLGNLSILQRYTSTFRFVIYDPDYRIDVISETTEFVTEPGSRISIVPLSPASGIQYEGLEYTLPDGSITQGVNEGTCNRALHNRFNVTLESGVLMVFRPLTLEVVPP